MSLNEPPIRGLRVFDLPRFDDPRGMFTEMWRSDRLDVAMAQSNHSRSTRGVLRGLHFHTKQSDLWYVVHGRLRAAFADLRNGAPAPTATLDLSHEHPVAVFIPPGVAHGFAALEDVDLVYHVSHVYDPADEFSIAWDDPELGIDWGIEDPLLSDRDKGAAPLDWEMVGRTLSGAHRAEGGSTP